MENNAGSSNVNRVIIKQYYACDINQRICEDINFDYDFQVRAIGKKREHLVVLR